MDAISAALTETKAGRLHHVEQPSRLKNADNAKAEDPEQTADVARQFEAILLRQILSESMKPLLEDGPSGQVYGYLLTDSLADSISKGGGMGLASILQTQLDKTK